MKTVINLLLLVFSVNIFADDICMEQLRCKEHKLIVSTVTFSGPAPGPTTKPMSISVEARYIKNGKKMVKTLGGPFNAQGNNYNLAKSLCEDRIEDLIFEYGKCENL